MTRILKRVGLLVGAVGFLAVAVAYTIGSREVGRTYDVEPAALRIPTDSVSIARGAHVAAIHGCVDCHTADLGGQVFVDAPPFRVVASNLTRGTGGLGGRYTDADWDRSIRHGVKPDGHAVIIMPAATLHHLADSDAADLIAFLKSLPPVDRPLPVTEVRLVGRLLAAGLVDPDIETDPSPTSREPAPPAGASADFGAYLARTICTHCHGASLGGDQPGDPDSPYAPDLAAAGEWTLAQFAQALRTGNRPAGPRLDPRFMPWTSTMHMSDDEIAALYAYLGTIRPSREGA